MTVATASRTSGSASPRRARLVVALAAAALVLTSCGGGDQSEEAEESASPSATASELGSPSPTASPTPEPPSEPRFRPGRAGKRAFVKYIVDGWSYGLNTNDPSVLMKASSGKKPCRGCGPFRDELKQREDEGWYVRFPGAKLRKVTFRPDGEIEVATAIVDIPASQSFHDDGTVRNDNEAHRGARFLIDLREEGKRKNRQWTLAAFSIK
jgi:hypothetical protein